jgi:hypothetical protein
MDNLGGNGGIPTGVGESQKAPENIAPMGEIPNFDEFLKSQEGVSAPEVVPENAEVAEQPAEAEQMTEPTMPAMPEPETPDEIEESPEVATLKSVNVSRDAEELPKEYVEGISKIISADKDDPRKLLNDLDIARWDMMKKAFGRNKGDGLNGSGGNGSDS